MLNKSLNRMLILLLACMLLLPAASFAENAADWREADMEILAVTEERYLDLLARAAESGQSSSIIKKKYGAMFTAVNPLDMIRKGIESGDVDSYLEGCAVIRQLQQLGTFSADNSAWLDELIAAGDTCFVTGSPEPALAMIETASADPGLAPVFTWSLRVFRGSKKQQIARIMEFLEITGYTAEEYAEDSIWISALSVPAEAQYICMPDGTAALFRYAGTDKEYEVLSEYEGCPVTVICSGAFLRSGICSVTLPDTLTVIGKRAFGSTPLSAVRIPDSVTEIGEGAFAGCLLESVVLPECLTEIGAFAFAANPYLHSLSIPEGVRSIGMSAFSMSGLPEELVIPGSVENIGEYAFAGYDTRIGRYMADAATDYVVIPNPVFPESVMTLSIGNGVKSIGKYAFAGRPVEDVFLPESVETVGECAFTDARNVRSFNADLKSIRVAPENPVLRSIGGSLFDRQGERLILCATEEQVYTVPEGTRSIARYAFSCDDSPSSVILPESLTTLEDYAFCGCTDVEPVLIPAGVTEIGIWAFYTDTMLSRTVSILVYPGSCAEQFCRDHGIPYTTVP